MIILFCFVIQAIAYEYRSKPNNLFGKKTYETFLIINGAVGTIFLGTAVATFFTGSRFVIDMNNITNPSDFTISQWLSPWHGIEAITDWRNLALGIAVFFLARVLAILYFINNIDEKNIIERAKKHLLINAIPFVLFFLAFIIAIFMSEGFSYLSGSNLIFMEKYKYFYNMIEMPLVGLFFVTGVLLVLTGIFITLIKNTSNGIWFSGFGVFLTVFTLFITVGFNNTAFYPSLTDFQSSITIQNGSSSHYTLTVMSYVSLFIPFVIAYIFFAWRAINNKKMDVEELNEDTHVY
jgi:cytochrome d ubiquinol oxidase subunit II